MNPVKELNKIREIEQRESDSIRYEYVIWGKNPIGHVKGDEDSLLLYCPQGKLIHTLEEANIWLQWLADNHKCRDMRIQKIDTQATDKDISDMWRYGIDK